MRASASFKIDFSGVEVSGDDLIGAPGDYHREPYFSGGAIRFAAVQLGGAEALLDHVRFQKMQVPERFPDDTFDLSLLSEVGYYWSLADLSKARRLIAAHLASQGHLLLVHWTPYVEGYPLTGDEVHELFLNEGAPALRHRTGRRAEHYRLDLFEAQG